MPKSLLLALLCLFSYMLQAQPNKPVLSTKSNKAIQLYQEGLKHSRMRLYENAVSSFQQAIKKDEQFGEAYLKLANVYRAIGEDYKAYEAYKKGLSLLPVKPELAPEYLNYGEFALLNGEYAEAEKYLGLFFQSKPNNATLLKAAQKLKGQVDFALEAIKHPVPFKPVRLGPAINQFRKQYLPAVTADEQYFLYTGRAGATGDNDEDIYIAEKRPDGWSSPKPISEAVNTPDNEGAASISGDGKTLVFTACDRPDSKGSCDLYISYRIGDKWSRPVNLGGTVNSSGWDSQPSLSADGRTLYFASERRGGLGATDLYVTTKGADDNWQAPRNLGAPVNTASRESSPCLHASSSTLYFASDGHPGMGGVDLFKTDWDEKKGWHNVVNLGYPLNTNVNESSIFIDSRNNKGYFSKDMTLEGQRRIDLFEFAVPPQWRSKVSSVFAKGTVYDGITKKPLQAQVELFDLATGSSTLKVNSDPVTGQYVAVLNEGMQYAMYAMAEKYLPHSAHFDYTNPAAFNPLTLDIYLYPVKKGSAIVLANLFFASKEYALQEKSKTELTQLISFLQSNKDIKVEISGHTDDVGTEADNNLLSERRARSVQDYLREHGIAPTRIVAKGYGEEKPAVPNDSDENRAKNRRIELRIL